MENKQRHITFPLDEALEIAGSGLYTKYVILVTGLMLFLSMCNVQMMSVIIPVASCDLHLTGYQKGILTSVGFAGVTLSSHLFGFLSDMCGRRIVMLFCTFTAGVISLLSSLSPDYIILAICWFFIGFMTGGIFAPAYVYAGEFCSPKIRAKALLTASSMCALSTVYVPCMAWLIVPLHINIPIIGNLVFTSWRLILAIYPITIFIPMLMAYPLPETPKFVLNEGKEEETLQILKSIFSVNNRKSKEEFPVQRVCLDYFDAISQQKVEEGSPFKRMLKTMISQAISLFSSRFIVYTTVSSLMMMGVLGSYNSFILWMPEQTKLLILHAKNNTGYKATICEIIKQEEGMMEEEGSCDLKIELFLPLIIIGFAQFLAFLVVGQIAGRISKQIIVMSTTAMSAVASIGLIFANELLQIIFCVGVIVVLMLTTYPVTLSIAVDFFPTSLRSTAASVVLLFGRLAATLGSQVMGYLYHENCHTAYWSIAAVLSGVLIVCALSPSKRMDQGEKTQL